MAKRPEYTDGFYRDKKDKRLIVYIHREGKGWAIDSSEGEGFFFHPNFFKDIEKVEDPTAEIERFRKVIGFVEKKLNEDTEERRRH